MHIKHKKFNQENPKNVDYRKALKQIFEQADYSFDIIKEELSSRLKHLWKDVQKLRFKLNPKEAFKKIQTITKHHLFKKSDGSIISKVKYEDKTIHYPYKDNELLGIALQNLCGNESSSTLTECDTFQNLELLTIN